MSRLVADGPLLRESLFLDLSFKPEVVEVASADAATPSGFARFIDRSFSNPSCHCEESRLRPSR